MATIYVLTSGEYSAYSINGVYSTMEKAETQKELLKWQGGGENSIEIEEWELDKPLGEEKATLVGMEKDGTTYMTRRDIVNLSEGKPQFEVFSNGQEVLLLNTVVTEDVERAVKVTNELRARLIALDLWHTGDEKVSCPQCDGTGIHEESLCTSCKGHGKIAREQAVKGR